jgi:predicted permease
METLLQDLRYAVRSLRRTPGFAFTVIAVMALGIGVNAFIYSAVRAILFANLPFPNTERMVMVQSQRRASSDSPFEMSLPDVRDVIQRSRTLQAVGAWTEFSAFVTTGGDAQRFDGTLGSPGLAAALGVQPVLGRWFTADECRGDAVFVPVVIGHRTWRELLAGDPNVLGRSLRLNGRVRTVVGVMPEGFRFPESAEFFVPLRMDDSTDNRAAHYLDVVARLAPGATLKQANAEVGTIARDLSKLHSDTNKNMMLVVSDYRAELGRGPRPAIIMLMIAVLFVLLIACANVANLQLARASARQREVGVRIAMGATRGRLVRQMVTESLLLSAVGGVLGVLVGQWAMRVTLASIPVQLPYWMHFDIDGQVLLVVLGLSVLAGVAFGLAPALQTTSGDVLTPLRESTPGGGDTPAARRMRGTLVVAEIAIAVLLLVGSGLMVRSFLRETAQRSLLRTEGVLTGRVTLPVALYKDDRARRDFFREFRGLLALLPGVHVAGGAANLHLGTSRWGSFVQREGKDSDKDAEKPNVSVNIITPGYLEAVGLPLRRGRVFTDADDEKAPRVALINEAAAKLLWPNEDPLGKRWRFGEQDTAGWITVVGVVANVRQHVKLSETRMAEVLLPHSQNAIQALTFALRADGDPGVLAANVRRMLRHRDPNLPFYEARSLDEHLRRAVWEPRLYAQLMSVFSLLALVIAGLGIHGVMAYTVSQRTREIGIRMALGAARADVQRLVMGQALRLTALGLGLGLALAFGLTRFMQAILFGIRPDDPPTFVGVTVILALSSVAAVWLPTARAVRVDPVVALRHE